MFFGSLLTFAAYGISARLSGGYGSSRTILWYDACNRSRLTKTPSDGRGGGSIRAVDAVELANVKPGRPSPHS
ncbi:hypothetical protein RB7532 [Rhodopirellula baltica SH 1]|uniref:Uncharacterized protein n=1 Tax=Rhodopirellula baltica (strain DSM 10527 / NCIMB 13988 / SH1) TaxID=243090 RepID=Q7UNK6_RHOBA|nr:hypothetical protein RB7532 [Rhodopirellula baltica SH 1]